MLPRSVCRSPALNGKRRFAAPNSFIPGGHMLTLDDGAITLYLDMLHFVVVSCCLRASTQPLRQALPC